MPSPIIAQRNSIQTSFPKLMPSAKTTPCAPEFPLCILNAAASRLSKRRVLAVYLVPEMLGQPFTEFFLMHLQKLPFRGVRDITRQNSHQHRGR